jgi:hypothetical protein
MALLAPAPVQSISDRKFPLTSRPELELAQCDDVTQVTGLWIAAYVVTSASADF